MNRSTRNRISTLAALAAVLALGVTAGPALASTYTLNLSAQPTAAVGERLLLRAYGVNPPPDEYWNSAWMTVVAIPTSVLATCPDAVQDGTSVAENAGGEIITIALRPNLDGVGNFSNLIGFTPWAPGTLLLCAYEDDGAGL